MTIGFFKGFATVLDALIGGEPGAFSTLLVAEAESPQLIISPEIDLTATASGIVISPGRPGYFFMPSRIVGCGVRKAGSLSGAPTLTGPLGLTTAGTNIFNSIQFALAQPSMTGAAITGQACVAPGVAITCDVTVAAVGSGLTWVGRVGYLGAWVPA